MRMHDVQPEFVGVAARDLEVFHRPAGHFVRVLLGAFVGAPVTLLPKPLESRHHLVADLRQPVGDDPKLADHSVDVVDSLPARRPDGTAPRASGG